MLAGNKLETSSKVACYLVCKFGGDTCIMISNAAPNTPAFSRKPKLMLEKSPKGSRPKQYTMKDSFTYLERKKVQQFVCSFIKRMIDFFCLSFRMKKCLRARAGQPFQV